MHTTTFGDATRLYEASGGNIIVEATLYFQPPSFNRAGFTRRHGDAANVAWADGHVDMRKPKILFGTYEINSAVTGSQNTVSADIIRELGSGDLDLDGDPATNDAFDLE